MMYRKLFAVITNKTYNRTPRMSRNVVIEGIKTTSMEDVNTRVLEKIRNI